MSTQDLYFKANSALLHNSQFLPTSSLNIDLDSAFLDFDFFSLGLLGGRSAKISVSSLNKSSSFVTAFFGRFVALDTAVGGAMSESTYHKRLHVKESWNFELNSTIDQNHFDANISGISG